MSRRTTPLRLAVRGLWFRRSTAVIVLTLATVATAAAVVAPLYARSAEESIVRGTLLSTNAYSRGVHVSRPQPDLSDPIDASKRAPFAEAAVRTALTDPVFGRAQVAYQAHGVFHPTAGPQKGVSVTTRVVERTGEICLHLQIADGRCPSRPNEALVTTRSLRLIGAHVGDKVAIDLPELGPARDGAPRTLRISIVGAVQPVSTDDAYWVGQSYFKEYFPLAREKFLKFVPARADPVFLGRGTSGPAEISGYTVDVPILSSRVRLSHTSAVRHQVATLDHVLGGYGLAVTTQLPDAIARADHGRSLVRIASPLAVTQLVLLAWWTLFLVVGSATEERSLELGLAKLRGLSQGQTARFGLAEVVLLLLIAAPLGMVLGYAAVRLAGPHVFAPGTGVVFTSRVLLTVSVALSGGVVTAALAGRRVFRRSVTDLVRRVPPRSSGRRAGVLEGVVIALAVAGLSQLRNDRGGTPSPVALLGPGMVAVVGGLLAGRLLVVMARRRSARAVERGRAGRLVGWAGLARRPGTARVASVLAVATCLAIVAVQAWTVAARNRVERSSAEVGATVVLHVKATGSRTLLTAVRHADPGGRYAMAAVDVIGTNQQDRVLAVDTTRASVLRWGPPEAAPHHSIRSLLAPPLPASLTVRPGRLRFAVTVAAVDSPTTPVLSARLDRHGTPLLLRLGALSRGRHTFTATVPTSCAPTCRLAALSVANDVRDIGIATVRLSIASIAAGPEGAETPLRTDFGEADAWRPVEGGAGEAQARTTPGDVLQIAMSMPGGVAAEVVRGDAPDPLPAYVGARASRDPHEPGMPATVSSAGLSGASTGYRVAASGPLVPRAGSAAVLVDLDLALRQAASAPEGDREVWLSRDDPAAEHRLTRALARDGVRVRSRQTEASVEHRYAGDGAVLALRLLLVCGAAAVLVSIGALLVAAYVGRRQRAYEVAALRVVGMRRRIVRGLLVRENLGAVLVALGVGAAAALVATWFVLPALPQFDTTSRDVPLRYAPDAVSGWLTLGALAVVLGAIGLLVAGLQLRAGRPERLREGVR